MAVLQFTPRVARRITVEDVKSTPEEGVPEEDVAVDVSEEDSAVVVCVPDPVASYPVWLMGSLNIQPPLSRDDDYRILAINLETRFAPYNTECSWMTNASGQLVPNPDKPATDFVAWLRYLIETIFEPAGHVLNGDVKWIEQGYHRHLSVSNSQILVV